MAEAIHDAVVSFDSESLILVDAADREIGHATKAACHHGDGMLHRAFSLFVFDSDGQLLLQRRAGSKRLWPGYWSNSCCSHPRRGETMEAAIHRRLRQELGLRCPLDFIYKFEYCAAFGSYGAEHELCSVYAGVSNGPVRANASEVSATRWVMPTALDREIADAPTRFTPWLRMEWARLRDEYAGALPMRAKSGR